LHTHRPMLWSHTLIPYFCKSYLRNWISPRKMSQRPACCFVNQSSAKGRLFSRVTPSMKHCFNHQPITTHQPLCLLPQISLQVKVKETFQVTIFRVIPSRQGTTWLVTLIFQHSELDVSNDGAGESVSRLEVRLRYLPSHPSSD